MKRIAKQILACAVFLSVAAPRPADACTGISLVAKDGSQVIARTIEWGDSYLPSMYVVFPRGIEQTSYTPSGRNGLTFKAKYGVVGLSIIEKEFISDGLNEAGLAAGLFYFPHYGAYEPYDPAQNARTLADMQLVSWLLSQFATVAEVEAALKQVRVVTLEEPGATATVHWRVADTTGRQIVIEFVNGVPQIYENKLGVLTNAPEFPWHLKNLNNYVNLYPGGAPAHPLGGVTVFPFGAGSGFLGLPGDVTPPSRFVRAAFFQTTAPQQPTADATVFQSFHILNNFDIPVGIEHAEGKSPDIPSATQWTVATDITHQRIFYKTAYNNTIRCIDLKDIDFGTVKAQAHPLDETQVQPVEKIRIR